MAVPGVSTPAKISRRQFEDSGPTFTIVHLPQVKAKVQYEPTGGTSGRLTITGFNSLSQKVVTVRSSNNPDAVTVYKRITKDQTLEIYRCLSVLGVVQSIEGIRTNHDDWLVQELPKRTRKDALDYIPVFLKR